MKQGKMNKSVSLFDRIIGTVRNEDDLFDMFIEQLEDWAEAAAMKKPMVSNLAEKNETIAEFIGVSQPAEVGVFSLSGIQNKGRAPGKRLVGAAERAAKIEKKPKRLCRSCHKNARHDSRNCPEKRSG